MPIGLVLLFLLVLFIDVAAFGGPVSRLIAVLLRLILLFSIFVVLPLWMLKAAGLLPRSWVSRWAAILDTLWASLSIEQKREVFLVCAFSMIAKLAKIDGSVSPAEIQAVERYIQDELALSEAQRQRVIEIFRRAKDSGETFEFFARKFHDAFSRQPAMLGHMIAILLQVASADHALTADEDRLIRSAALLFGFSPSHYEFLRTQHAGEDQAYDFRRSEKRTAGGKEQKKQESTAIGSKPTLEECYAMLGCARESSENELKKAYRKLALEHHPDRVRARGLPEEFTRVANRKFAEIQHAYDAVRTARGLK